LGWYCIKLVSKSQPPLSLSLSRSKPSWESLLILRSCVARQASKSHFKPSSLRLKVHSWLSLQQCTKLYFHFKSIYQKQGGADGEEWGVSDLFTRKNLENCLICQKMEMTCSHDGSHDHSEDEQLV